MEPRERGQRRGPQGAEPLPPKRKWQTITIATLLLVPAFWALLSGLVASVATTGGGPDPAAALALGLALIPFVFIVLAFGSQHPHAATAVLKAMGLSLVVGVPISALAADAVTGMVAGVGAGAIVALRSDDDWWKARLVAVAAVTLYTFVLIRLAGPIVLLSAPVLPLTSIGLADHLAERSRASHA